MSNPIAHPNSLARQARELFVVHVGRALPDVVKACDGLMSELRDHHGSSAEVLARRDAWLAYQQHHNTWLGLAKRGLQRLLLPPAAINSGMGSMPAKLELVDDGVVKDQILASRLAMKVLDKASSELNELRLRIQHLERRQELSRDDPLLPDVIARVLIEQWVAAGMTRDALAMIQDGLGNAVADKLLGAYQAANRLLVDGGVMKEIDLQALVKRAPGASSSGRGSAGDTGSSGLGSSTSSGGVGDETRMLTGTTPLARARMRAQGVVGRLRRLLMDRLGGEFEATQILPPSPQLQQAIQRSAGRVSMGASLDVDLSGPMGQVHVDRAAAVVRQRTAELKQAASTPTEKATVEIVALMFQSILAEERIPASVRVWFARLQIPVLRVALAEPDFFGSLQHPARQLIDRMGSCVMGFESGVSSSALEAEIRRVVQVIEQYPETGRRVFQLVLDEFQKFLATHLHEQGDTRRVVSVAQQIEQKETLSVQYTIELRKLLEDVPVRDEVREFLFKVWVDVLAVASVKHGQKSDVTRDLKQVASDLLWAASAKPNRSDRARVIQQLPGILQRLRKGMGLLGYPPGMQDEHIKAVSDTLADAFMSRTEPIAEDHLARLAQRLANLEDYLPQDGVGDLDLDANSIELITGVDASNIEVVNTGGSQPTEAMRAWATELQIGAWFGLEHGGKLNNAQLVWRSERGQLYLFVAPAGRCFLMQAARVAAYLQAGLLLPSEEEALTVRATRDALAKLDAHPERLLA